MRQKTSLDWTDDQVSSCSAPLAVVYPYQCLCRLFLSSLYVCQVFAAKIFHMMVKHPKSDDVHNILLNIKCVYVDNAQSWE